jgi:hypothetical protein
MRARRRGGASEAQRRVSAWLGIAALLLQLIATAVHFHAEDFAFLAGDGDTIAAASTGQAGEPAPLNAPLGAAHHDDAFCFSLQVASASAVPAPISLGPPCAEGSTAFPPLRAFRLVSAAHLPFQTRAPPVL